MSAYVVEPFVIDFVISAFDELCRDRGQLSLWIHPHGEDPVRIHSKDQSDMEAFDLLGAEIFAENVRSVNYRYGDRVNDDQPDYSFRFHRGVYMGNHRKLVAQALRSIGNIEYQSCEHPEWQGSRAQMALNAMARQIANASPDLAGTEWGAPPHPAENEGPRSLTGMSIGR